MRRKTDRDREREEIHLLWRETDRQAETEDLKMTYRNNNFLYRKLTIGNNSGLLRRIMTRIVSKTE